MTFREMSDSEARKIKADREARIMACEGQHDYKANDLLRPELQRCRRCGQRRIEIDRVEAQA